MTICEENPHAENVGSIYGTGTNTTAWDDESAAVYDEGQSGMRRQAGEAMGTATTKVKEAAGTVTEQAKQQLGQATDTTREELSHLTDQVRHEADGIISEQKSMAADRLDTFANTLRQTSRQLQDQEEDTIGRYAEIVADQIEMASDFLRTRNTGDLLGEVQRLARRSPEAFVAGSLAVGFLLGRFIKGPSRSAIDSQQGQQDGQGYQGYSRRGYADRMYSEGSRYGSGLGYESRGYQAEGADDIKSNYEGGINAYQTGPDITEGSDTDYPRYDPSYAGGSSIPEAHTEANDESTSEGSGYTPTSAPVTSSWYRACPEVLAGCHTSGRIQLPGTMEDVHPRSSWRIKAWNVIRWMCKARPVLGIV